MTTQTQVMETLSYLLGERTVPTTATEGRRNFIQRTVEEVYRTFPWTFAKRNVTLTIDNGLATLPAAFDDQHKLYAYFDEGDEEIVTTEIDEGDRDMYITGSNRFWLEAIDNGYIIRTKDNYPEVNIRYQAQAPTLSATVGTPLDDPMVLALGARRYVKLSQNPDADISQDESLFQKRLGEKISATHVSRPMKKHRAIYKANHYRLGEV